MLNEGKLGVGNTTQRDLWITPPMLWSIVNKQYNFDFDCCASVDNRKTELYSSDFESVQSVSGTAWMNPPFTIAKRMFTHFFKVVDKGVGIYRCDNLETLLWQNVIFKHAHWIFIPKGRINYVEETFNSTQESPFPSALIGYNVPPIKNMQGVLLIIK